MSRARLELSGQQFGRLTVIEFAGIKQYTGYSYTLWRCRCDCGNETVVYGKNLTKGSTTSCGCYGGRGPFLEGDEAAFRRVLKTYRQGAKGRTLEFTLTPEQFRHITSQPCVYCGQEPHKTARPSHWKTRKNTRPNDPYIYNGLDRVDNSLGYTEDNCVPCCEICNHMKWNLTRNEFLSHVHKIAAFSPPN